jgi:hypothetical protein
VKVNNGDERMFWPCRGGEVKREGESRAAAPRPPHGLVGVPSSRNGDMSLESLGCLGSLEPSKPSKPSKL